MEMFLAVLLFVIGLVLIIKGGDFLWMPQAGSRKYLAYLIL